jgi:hypothetical protein
VIIAERTKVIITNAIAVTAEVLQVMSTKSNTADTTIDRDIITITEDESEF